MRCECRKQQTKKQIGIAKEKYNVDFGKILSTSGPKNNNYILIFNIVQNFKNKNLTRNYSENSQSNQQQDVKYEIPTEVSARD